MKKFVKNNVSGGKILLLSIFVVNILNFVFNAYLGRVLTFEQFGLVTLINTMWFLALIPFNALYVTVNQRSAYLIAKKNTKAGLDFLNTVNKKNLILSLIISAGWIVLIPFIDRFFQVNDFLVPLLFTPIITLGILVSANKGFLQGNLNFFSVAAILLFEALSKLIFAWIFVESNLSYWVYASIPLSVFVSYLVGVFITKQKVATLELGEKHHYGFPKKFFSAAVVTGLATTAILSFDLLLAKHFLSPAEAGQYALLSLIGKMVYFFGTLPSILTITYVSRDTGRNIDPKGSFYKLFSATIVLSVLAFVAIGILGKEIVPILLGNKAEVILPYLTTYSAAIMFFAISASITGYHLAKQQYTFPIVGIIMAVIMSIGIILNHGNISQITQVIFDVSVLSILITGTMHLIETSKVFNFKERWLQMSYE